ncbi:MAG: DUF5718 family protein [Treponema sp.]|nr:DUF5718 family protein [Treponema sp.]
MNFDLKDIATFGVAGNFTGHLEQAGEDKDFLNIKTKEAIAPKALFPTYIPGAENTTDIPSFLGTFPFDSEKIIFPQGEEKLQIEPECAIIFEADWQNQKITHLKPLCFGASNDCSIRKEGAKKISLKKNWGPSSKGLSSHLIPLSTFDSSSTINDYRIASFLLRDGKAYAYGEDSAVRDYSYVYEKLTQWIIDKLNNQQNEGPAEKISDYLISSGCPKKILVSIGATRYTSFGQNNFLQKGDKALVILYPQQKYTIPQIQAFAQNPTEIPNDISLLCQEIY